MVLGSGSGSRSVCACVCVGGGPESYWYRGFLSESWRVFVVWFERRTPDREFGLCVWGGGEGADSYWPGFL